MKRRPFLAALCLLAALTPTQAQVRPVWTNRYDNALPEKSHTPLAIALDKDGNVLIGGSSLNASNDYDYVVLKYASSGTPLWTNRYDSGSNDTARGFSVDVAGNAYLTGTSETVKFGTTGALAWHAAFGARAVATATNGNVYVTGFSEVDFATARLDATTGTNIWTRMYDKIGRPDVSYHFSLSSGRMSQAVAFA